LLPANQRKRLDEVVEMDSDRKHCRNPHCRQKLEYPTDNDHHAFCCRGCFNSFYLNRCRVCERPLRDKRGGRRYCRAPNKCRREAAKWPQKYEFQPAPVLMDVCTLSESRSADKMGLKSGLKPERPRHRALRQWSWHSNELEHELRDSTGTLIARLESNAGRHRLTYPRTFPILSSVKLDEAKQRAEAIALTHLKLVVGVNIERPELARINTANTRPHPMSAPLSMSYLPVADAPPIAPPEPFDGDPLEIPEFLRKIQ
jgi:hypothetical protein